MDRETILALGSALEDLGRAEAVSRGGQRNSGQFYQTLAEAGQKKEQRRIDEEKLKQEAVRQRVLDTYKQREDQRAQAKFDAEAQDLQRKQQERTQYDDPNSDISATTREIAAQVLPGKDLSKFSATQLNAIMPPDKILALQEQKKMREQTARDAAAARQAAAAKEAEQKQVSPITKKPLTEGQKKVDQDYAKQYNEFSAKGAATARTTIEQLEEFKRQLEDESKKVIQSGGGRIGSMLPDAMRTDQSIIWKRDIPAKANLVLKDLFGGQLSNDERKSESQTYYDDMLGPKENAKKLGEKIKQLRAGYENESRKAKYYERFGTLDGFSAEASPSEGSSKIRVSNGKETLEIDPADEKEAAAEGFRRVP
jgi:hypothetical protein